MHPFIIKLKAQAEEQPILAIGVAAGAITSLAKFVDAVASVRSKRAYAKRMNRPAPRRR